MKHDHRDLERLFAPPPNQYGTHMLLCGLSADTETLERVVASFTGESTVERAAGGLIRTVLMLDASAPPMSPLAVPGLQRLAHCDLTRWSAQTSLMHAKVALLGFADEKFAAPTTFRLVVSTGNWTRETWGNGAQIDMFWSTECQVGSGTTRTDAFADTSAALTFFDRLMQGLYSPSANHLAAQPLAMGWLTQWRALLGQEGRQRKSRFVHSLDKSLFAQIKQRFPDDGVSQLVAGSGFWEQPGREAGAKPEVLKKLDELTVRGDRYLVANPQQAGAIAHWVAANPKTARPARIDCWTLCTPRDPLQTKKTIGRTFLHAKYIAGLTRVAATQSDKGTMTFLYVGSGNLSRAGLLSKAALSSTSAPAQGAGNVEAGVILVDKQEVPRVWSALACGDELSDGQIKAMEPGTDEQILKPQAPPPVLFAQVVADRLQLIRSTDAAGPLELRLEAVGPWIDVGAANNELPLKGNVPPIVWVRVPPASEDETAAVYEVPVLSEDGVCCRQAPNALEIDDVLEALLAFPSAGPHLPDPETSPAPTVPSRASTTASRYPLKVIAALIEAIAQRNTVLTQEQFPVWLSQLRFLLLEQVSEADRDAIRRAGINLFPALLTPGFAPAWLKEAPQLQAAYQTLVDDIAASWTPARTVSCEELTPNNDDGRKAA
jgi:hypothetical protein